jgi:hypothetical protein
MSKELVISYYGENLDWVNGIVDYKITIYNKSDNDIPNTIKLNNIGREMQSYFYHIVNNYDNLCDWVFFTQADPYDHVRDYNSILNFFPESSSYGKLNYEECYFFSNGVFNNKLPSYSNGMPTHSGFLLNVDYIWSQLFTSQPPPIYEFTAGAIFCVSKNQIQKRTKEFYNKCLKISEERETSPWEFERMMIYLFIDQIK